jgi:hypothetical protein
MGFDSTGLCHAAFIDKGGVTGEDIDRAVDMLKKNDTCFIHYVVKDNTIYTKGYGKYQVGEPLPSKSAYPCSH